jgi:hypothetical protein
LGRGWWPLAVCLLPGVWSFWLLALCSSPLLEVARSSFRRSPALGIRTGPGFSSCVRNRLQFVAGGCPLLKRREARGKRKEASPHPEGLKVDWARHSTLVAQYSLAPGLSLGRLWHLLCNESLNECFACPLNIRTGSGLEEAGTRVSGRGCDCLAAGEPGSSCGQGPSQYSGRDAVAPQPMGAAYSRWEPYPDVYQRSILRMRKHTRRRVGAVLLVGGTHGGCGGLTGVYEKGGGVEAIGERREARGERRAKG